MFHDCIDIVDRSVTNDFDIIQIYFYTPILEISLNQFWSLLASTSSLQLLPPTFLHERFLNTKQSMKEITSFFTKKILLSLKNFSWLSVKKK